MKPRFPNALVSLCMRFHFPFSDLDSAQRRMKKRTVDLKSNELSVNKRTGVCLIHSGYIKCTKCNAVKVCTTKDGIHWIGVTNALTTTEATATMANG